MKLYGLTGGIASGKSTVARLLRALGATVIDADQLAREVVRPGRPAWEEIRARWPEVVGQDGEIDRARLGEIGFSDTATRAELGAITHPRIAEEGARRNSSPAWSAATTSARRRPGPASRRSCRWRRSFRRRRTSSTTPATRRPPESRSKRSMVRSPGDLEGATALEKSASPPGPLSFPAKKPAGKERGRRKISLPGSPSPFDGSLSKGEGAGG